MSKLAENEKKLLEQFTVVAKNSGKLTPGKFPIFQFKNKLLNKFLHTKTAYPWLLIGTLFFYRHRLKIAEQKYATLHLGMLTGHEGVENRADKAKQFERAKEQVESLRFAAQYGCSSDAQGRDWFAEQVQRYQITAHDAAFFVWNRTLNVRKQKINFGHWDWIFGCLFCAPLLPIAKIIYDFTQFFGSQPLISSVMIVYLSASLALMFSIFSKPTFVLYWTGRKYFKPDGLKYTPL